LTKTKVGGLSVSTFGAIEVSDVSLTHSDKRLFDGLNLTLEAQRTTAIIGRSGVGKSSLLRLIAGLPPSPLSGSVRDSSGYALDGRIAYMGQQHLLLPWAGVRDNVLIGGRLRGETLDIKRANALIDAVGLSEYSNALPYALSGGMRQRVALARTLMEDRPIILMDEPFSALDALSRHQLQELAAKLLGDRTVVLVTHDPLEAVRLSHVVYVMAGQPANLHEAATLSDETPRDITRDDIVVLQRKLLLDLGLRPGSDNTMQTGQIGSQ